MRCFRFFLSGLVLLLLAVLGALPAAAWGPDADPAAEAAYAAYRAAQVGEAARLSRADAAARDNLFYRGPDPAEWPALAATVDRYYALRALLDAGQQEALRLAFFATLERGFGVRVLGVCHPIGYYSLWSRVIYVSATLFDPGYSAAHVRSVLYHEKVHQRQLETLPVSIVAADMRLPYSRRMLEIAAHYLQLRYCLESGDGVAWEAALTNSAAEGMLGPIIDTYPNLDPVVAGILAAIEVVLPQRVAARP